LKEKLSTVNLGADQGTKAPTRLINPITSNLITYHNPENRKGSEKNGINQTIMISSDAITKTVFGEGTQATPRIERAMLIDRENNQ
jgi:hypothetical protein